MRSRYKCSNAERPKKVALVLSEAEPIFHGVMQNRVHLNSEFRGQESDITNEVYR